MGFVSAGTIPGQVLGLIAIRAWIPPAAGTGKTFLSFNFGFFENYFVSTTQGNVFLAVK
jgi:hypothetical protein